MKKTITRQQKWQEQQRRNGRCRMCARPVKKFTAGKRKGKAACMCARHLAAEAQRANRRYARRKKRS